MNETVRFPLDGIGVIDSEGDPVAVGVGTAEVTGDGGGSKGEGDGLTHPDMNDRIIIKARIGRNFISIQFR